MTTKLHYYYCRREGEEIHLFEGSKTALIKWLKANKLWREYKRNKIRIGFYYET